MSEEREVRELIESAGPRSEPPPERLARIRAAARAEWEALPSAAPRGPRRTLPWAIAAGLLVATAAAWWLGRERPRAILESAPIVARVELVRGGAERVDAGGDRAPLEAGGELRGGATVAIPPAPVNGGAALRLAGGAALRVDAGTRVRLLSGGRIELASGAVYLDSDGVAAQSPGVEVLTALGRVREIGTRFLVRLEPGQGSLEVGVRDGRVALDGGGSEREVGAGEALRLRADGSSERSAIDPWGPDWAWVRGVAPAPEIEGRRLDSFLEWLTRETGWRVEFDSAELAASAAAIRLHGTIEGLPPADAAEVVLSGAGLEHRVDRGVLRLSRP